MGPENWMMAHGQSFVEIPSESDPEHLRIPCGQLTEYQKEPQQGHIQNLLWELSRNQGELKEDAQLDELKGRILKINGNVRSSRWIAGGNWW